MKRKLFFAVMAAAYTAAFVQTARAQGLEKGFSLTEIDYHQYDAYENSPYRTEAQEIVDRLFNIGVRHVILSPRATMIGPYESRVRPVDGDQYRGDQYLRLIRYIHSKGMTVGIRPQLFVVDQFGNTPYRERQPDGSIKVWWHGNIRPEDPYQWFASFRYYLEPYMDIAREGDVEEFTLGAELQSMTVGDPTDWPGYPDGFADQWVNLANYARQRIAKPIRLMYDVNYTDDYVEDGPFSRQGGEYALWVNRLLATAGRTNPQSQNLRALWSALDAVGIDMYRSLVAPGDVIPDADYNGLLNLLSHKTNLFASEINADLDHLAQTLGAPKRIIFKEVGFRSVQRGFIDPFNYEGSGSNVLNVMHQAVAYDAFFRSFYQPNFAWFGGVSFWDASVDINRHGPYDVGFSPLGKPETESVISANFNANVSIATKTP